MIYLKIALVILLISPTSAWCFGVGKVGVIGSGEVAASDSPTYIVSQDFGTDYTGWTESTTDGSIDGSYTTDILDGTHSLQVDSDGTGYTYTQISFTGMDDLWVYGQFKFENTADTAILAFRGTDAAFLGSLYYNNDGTVHVGQGTGISSTVSVSTTAINHFWIHYTSGATDGSMALYLSSSDTKPATATASFDDGSNADDVGIIRLYCKNYAVVLFDKIRVDDVSIGSDPD